MSKNNQADNLFAREQANKALAGITESYLEETRELISQVKTALLYSKSPHDQDDFLKKTTKELIRDIESLSFKITNAKNEYAHDLKPELSEMAKKLRELALLHTSITNGN